VIVLKLTKEERELLRELAKENREEYLKLLAEYGMTEEEDEAMSHIQYQECGFI
jgi:DNA-binding MarR family transcriptional regulator